MWKYIFKRILQTLPLLLIITFIVFTMMQLAPFDPVDSLITPEMTPQQADFIREKYGLDQPFLAQYFTWLKNAIQLDFGNSIISQTPIIKDMAVRIPNSIALVLPAIVISFVLAIVLGLLAGAYKNTWLDKLIDGFATIGIATPIFWFALLLIYIFSFRMGWFPSFGMHSIGQEGNFLDYLQHLILPLITLIMGNMPQLIRYVRSSTISNLDSEYVDVQLSLGASKSEILKNHVSKSVLIPIITQPGLALPMLVTGAVVVETVFQWPGMGSYFMSASQRLDYPVVLAVVLLSAVLVILGNLIADILYAVVDPRIRSGEEKA